MAWSGLVLGKFFVRLIYFVLSQHALINNKESIKLVEYFSAVFFIVYNDDMIKNIMHLGKYLV